jgi:DNA-binding NarL/FixJ family response regulator
MLMSVTILIVDDHEVLREGIRSILRRNRPQWEICGEASSGPEGVEAAIRLKPDVILLDITMPGMNGLQAASHIATLGLPSKILIFTMHESGELAHDARRAGASGYVTKADASRQLVWAIETLLSGGTFFGSPEKRPSASTAEGSPSMGMIFFRFLTAALCRRVRNLG